MSEKQRQRGRFALGGRQIILFLFLGKKILKKTGI